MGPDGKHRPFHGKAGESLGEIVGILVNAVSNLLSFFNYLVEDVELYLILSLYSYSSMSNVRVTGRKPF